LNSSSRLMKDAGIDCLPETAHRLLLDLKVWTYRNNPYPIRSGITLEEPQFPYQTYPDDDEREDLTYLNSYAIDNESSGDPDDAISYDNGILWVHIADPSPLVPLESDIDLEASHRGENLYLPEKIVHMLPVWISEQCCLGFKEVSPAISFGLKIDMETGDVFLERICLSKVKVQRHTYESVQQIEDRSDLQSIKDLLFRFKKFRADNGALFIDLPEVMIQVDESDKVHINRIAITPEREYVANAMIAAGYAVSKWAIENEIPMPFAVQAPPE